MYWINEFFRKSQIAVCLVWMITIASLKVRGFPYPCEAGSEYYQLDTENGTNPCKDCAICHPGYGTTKNGECFGLNDTQCRHCVRGQEYSVFVGVSRECFLCSKCSRNQFVVHQCNMTHDTECSCIPGYHFDEDVYECITNIMAKAQWNPNGMFLTSTDSITVEPPVKLGIAIAVTVVCLIIIIIVLVFCIKLRQRKSQNCEPDQTSLL